MAFYRPDLSKVKLEKCYHIIIGHCLMLDFITFIRIMISLKLSNYLIFFIICIALWSKTDRANVLRARTVPSYMDIFY